MIADTAAEYVLSWLRRGGLVLRRADNVTSPLPHDMELALLSELIRVIDSSVAVLEFQPEPTPRIDDSLQRNLRALSRLDAQ